MMIGWGGNNGSTLSATILANRHNIVWHTKSGVQQPNYIGSLLRASTVRLGVDPSTGKDVYVPISDVLPMVHPNDLVLGGWDISGAVWPIVSHLSVNSYQGCQRWMDMERVTGKVGLTQLRRSGDRRRCRALRGTGHPRPG